MKNFKLLLATTAILSTGLAANVKADDFTNPLVLHPTVTMITPLVYSVDQDLTFGKVAWEYSGSETTVVVTPNPLGEATISGTADYFGGAKQAKIFMVDSTTNNKYDMVLPTSAISLSAKVGQNTIPCGTVSGFTMSSSDISAYVGATFKTGEKPANFNGEDITCTGDAEITFVLKQ